MPLEDLVERAYTDAVSARSVQALKRDPKAAVLTAAMCEGNKLQKIRETFPDRFFDVGICESHAVAFAAGMAKAGARPVVDIYSTFLQRSLRPDLPGSLAAKLAGRLHDRPGRRRRGRRADAPRQL